MGNIITSPAFWTPSTTIGSIANSSFPLSNLTDYTHPYRPYKSSAACGTTIYGGLDFGTARAVVAVIVDNLNVASVKIQGNASDSWGSPSYDSGALTVSQDAVDGRYKIILIASFTYRYLRVVAATSDTTDDAAGLQIGSILACSAVTTWAQNPGFPYTTIPLRAGLDNADFGGGGREPVDLGNPYCQIEFGQSMETTSAVGEVYTLARTSRATPIVFYRNNSNTSEVYICRRVGTVQIQQAGPAHYSYQGVVLEEVV